MKNWKVNESRSKERFHPGPMVKGDARDGTDPLDVSTLIIRSNSHRRRSVAIRKGPPGPLCETSWKRIVTRRARSIIVQPHPTLIVHRHQDPL